MPRRHWHGASQLMCAKTFCSWRKFKQGFKLVLFERTWIPTGIQSLSILSNSLLQKRTDSSWTVLIKMWSICRKPAFEHICRKQTPSTSTLYFRANLPNVPPWATGTKFVGSRHRAAAFFLQVPKMCTEPDLVLSYISILETYCEFVRENFWRNLEC